MHTKSFDLDNSSRLFLLCGANDKNLRYIERHFPVKISVRGNTLQLKGERSYVDETKALLQKLYLQTSKSQALNTETIRPLINGMSINHGNNAANNYQTVEIVLPRCTIKTRSETQVKYLHSIKKNDVNFGVGPSGTGKTFLAVVAAVNSLSLDEINRIILVRPAVEAGEKLGFLPGDLTEKVDPYLRPLYDALFDLIGSEKVTKLIKKNIIEIAPLAYMRGRTLNDAFIIIDEAQNTTKEQMKMILTRLGFGSKIVINGDTSQVDLPRGQCSGLRHAIKLFSDIDGISMTHFKASDVVRHPIVQSIVRTYETNEAKDSIYEY
jgi:phosphate starvation-inducible protein PhoH and related proteins